eukprot:3509109-Alexandrium_andersonii.AAC.1
MKEGHARPPRPHPGSNRTRKPFLEPAASATRPGHGLLRWRKRAEAPVEGVHMREGVASAQRMRRAHASKLSWTV